MQTDDLGDIMNRFKQQRNGGEAIVDANNVVTEAQEQQAPVAQEPIEKA